MKPLSPILYIKNNRLKTFASIKTIFIAVAFIIIIYTMFENTSRLKINTIITPFKYSSRIYSHKNKEISKEILDEIKSNEIVDCVITTESNGYLHYTSLGTDGNIISVGLREKDLSYFLEKQHTKLILGRLPKEGEQEIAINEFVLKNRNLKIGDMVGSEINENDTIIGSYKIVGILQGEGFYSIHSLSGGVSSKIYFVFSKENENDILTKYIESLDKDKFYTSTLESVTGEFHEDGKFYKSLDIISIMSLVIIVMIVGISKYAEFLSKKVEIGILNALGYSKGYLLKRTFLEVSFTNFLGLILGIVSGIVANVIVNKVFWTSLGFELTLLFTWKSVFISLILTMFTTLFNVIPINNLIKKIDPIKIVEGE